MGEDVVRWGGKTIGWIERTGSDNYWTIATFRPSNDFEPVRDILEATINEDDEELTALERVNDLDLTVGEPFVRIRDFKMISKTCVEFKEGVWS